MIIFPGPRGARQIPFGRFTINRQSWQISNLVAWWPGLGNRGNVKTLEDWSDRRFHNIAWADSATDPTWVGDTHRGMVLDFDGTNDTLPHVATSNTLLDPQSDSFTASIWLRLGSSTGTTKMIFSKGNSVSSGNIGWSALITDAGVIDVKCNGDNTVAQRAGQRFTALTDNDWHLLTLVIDRRDDQIRGYLDSSNSGWVAHPVFGDSIAGFGSITTTRAFRLSANNTPALFFRGSLDDIRIRREVLSEKQIRNEWSPAGRWDLYKPLPLQYPLFEAVVPPPIPPVPVSTLIEPVPPIQTYHQSKELSILIEDPLVKADRTFSTRLTSQIDTYGHETRAIGGFWSASMTINDNQAAIDEWISSGLGRHIRVYNHALSLIWEGFVNKISARLGVNQTVIGELLSIGNRVSVRYSVGVGEGDIIGGQDETAVANNSASQTRYGIVHREYSINGATTADAEQIRDTYVNDPLRAFPAVDLDTNLSGGSGPSVNIECLGYWHWLGAYFYSAAAAATVNLSTKIQNIITADPNGIFSTDFRNIDENTYQVKPFASGKERGETIIKRLNSQGDASNNPYMIGCFGDRIFRYTQIPEEIMIQQRLTGNQGFVNRVNRPIEAWDIESGQWLFQPDFLTGRHPPISAATLGTDPRAAFVEVAKFSAPNGLSISGTKFSEIDQLLAKRGMGGLA